MASGFSSARIVGTGSHGGARGIVGQAVSYRPAKQSIYRASSEGSRGGANQ